MPTSRRNYEFDLAETIAQAADCKIVSVHLNPDEPGAMSLEIAGPIGSAQGSNGPTRKVYNISRRKVGERFELWATGDIAGLETIRHITFAEHLFYTRVVDLPAAIRESIRKQNEQLERTMQIGKSALSHGLGSY